MDQKRLTAFNTEILKDTGFVTKTAIGTFEVGYIHKTKLATNYTNVTKRTGKFVRLVANFSYFFQMNSLKRSYAASRPSEMVPLLNPSFHPYLAGYQVSTATICAV